MSKPLKTKAINRIIDANINRAKEGLRVTEEITRFILDNRSLTEDLKKIRHSLDSILNKFPAKKELLEQRYSLRDVGFDIFVKSEFKRKDFKDIFFANMQRVKESIRVLEEFSKLIDTKIASGFKKIRYNIYETEKKIAKKILSLPNHR
ncbi:MAG: thiamine-phosphate pyrophosphorylase [Candidatus Omnitrophica bacterium]|nr:thiamine-phosphate pyrophosphorylase [Candidatus Omnitrophota bacterium]